MLLKKPNEYAVCDVETTDIVPGEFPRTLFWGFADRNGYKQFKTTGQFIKFLWHDLEPRTIFFHTNFDINVMLNDGFYSMKIVKSHNGKLIAIRIGEHTLINSYAMFPASLELILKSFGYTKKPLTDIHARNYGDTVEALDCFQKLNENFIKQFAVSPFEFITIAATSFAAAELFAGKMEKDKRFIEAYRGGRVDIFDRRITDCGKWDINSSYAESFQQAQPDDELLRLEIVSSDYYGSFYDNNISERLLFPSGRFESYSFRSSLERFVQNDRVRIRILHRTPINMRWLCRASELLRTAFDSKRRAKADGDLGIELVMKFFLNSVYGRTGTRGVSEKATIRSHPIAKPGSSYIQMDWRSYLCFETIQTDSRANYPFAAFITDNARWRLYEGLKLGALYGDTDGIFLPAGVVPPNVGSELGQWKQEGYKKDDGTQAPPGDYEFEGFNLKHYRYGEEMKLKGGKKNTQWTLRQVAAGSPPVLVLKEQSEQLLKRVALPDGTTKPIEV